MYRALKNESILLIGDRYPNRINFHQMFDTEKIRLNNKEEDLRYYISEISSYILHQKNKPGTARKFLEDWKLLYYETISRTGGRNKIYALFSKQKNVNATIKQAMQSVVLRGGVYSAKRFFNEFLDIVEGKTEMDESAFLSVSKAMQDLENIDFHNMDVNYIGNLISFIQYHVEMENETLEKIYFVAYEMLNYLSSVDIIDKDIDLGLDGAYTVAEVYYDREIFHLALELYKRLLPLSIPNQRTSLFVASKIRIAQIYDKYFPESEQLVLDELEDIVEEDLEGSTKSQREIYYTMLGETYDTLKDYKKAEEYYLKVIKEAETNISEPLWVSKAYSFFARKSRQEIYPLESSRYFLTAAALAFSGGDLALSDQYRNFAANEELILAHWEVINALTLRMEKDIDSAIFKAWHALRLLFRAYEHADIKERFTLVNITTEVIDKAEIVLKTKGNKRKIKSFVNKIRKTIENLQFQKLKNDQEKEVIDEIINKIETNIPEPPPTFLLITNDGRLITSGIVGEDEWGSTMNLEGVIFSGILSAIMSLLSEVVDSSLKTIDAGNFKILVERSNTAICVLLVDRELHSHRERLQRILRYIDSDKYLSEKIIKWNGRHDFVEEIKTYVMKSIT
jgi:tetratricopeptide (TPR) repeat protein